MGYREVLGIHRVRKHDRDVLLDRIGGAVAQIRDQFVKPPVAFGSLRFARCALFGVPFELRT